MNFPFRKFSRRSLGITPYAYCKIRQKKISAKIRANLTPPPATSTKAYNAIKLYKNKQREGFFVVVVVVVIYKTPFIVVKPFLYTYIHMCLTEFIYI